MEKSESIKNIAIALSKFQAGIGKVKKEAWNPQFKKKYAGLDNIIDLIQNPLTDAGLSFCQFPDGDGLTTILMHTSGEWMLSLYNLTPEGNTPQKWGSAITYARRYALSSILGLSTEEDDDGNEASTPAKAAPPQTTPATTQKAPLTDEIMKAMKGAIDSGECVAVIEAMPKYTYTEAQTLEIQEYILSYESKSK